MLFSRFLFTTFLLFQILTLIGQDVPGPSREHNCLKCHAHIDYSFTNPLIGMEEKRLMNPYYILDTVQIATGVHRNFDCIDCHSSEYRTWPHKGELKLEPLFNCIDCHGGDETFAKYQFDRIDEEYHKSVHFTVSGDHFKCSSCHNPHYYRPMIRDAQSMTETIKYDNNMCLSCHSNKDKFSLLSFRGLYDVLDRHEWLPNQPLHFQNVRCIECHAEVNDTLLVAHNILSKEKAVKLCVECHSANSILMASLYRYKARENRSEFGFINAAILSESYVIGANRNYFLNMLSLAIFGIVILAIIGHAVLRKISRK